MVTQLRPRPQVDMGWHGSKAGLNAHTIKSRGKKTSTFEVDKVMSSDHPPAEAATEGMIEVTNRLITAGIRTRTAKDVSGFTAIAQVKRETEGERWEMGAHHR